MSNFSSFDPIHIRNSLVLMKLIVRSILNDYLPDSFSWFGVVGTYYLIILFCIYLQKHRIIVIILYCTDQTINSRIREKIKSASLFMDQLGFPAVNGLRVKTSSTTTVFESLWFINLAPVTSMDMTDTLREAVLVVDVCVTKFSSLDLDQQYSSAEQKRILSKLINNISDITTWLITNVMERFIFLAASCAIGYADAETKTSVPSVAGAVLSRSRSTSRSSSASSLSRQSSLEKPMGALLDAFSLLHEIPSPWNPCSQAESFADYLNFRKLFLSKYGKLPQGLASNIQDMSTKLPAFVLNLDRRYDRCIFIYTSIPEISLSKYDLGGKKWLVYVRKTKSWRFGFLLSMGH